MILKRQKMNQSTLYILIYFFIGINSLKSQTNDQIVIGNKYSIQSEVLSEKRKYWISIPESYDGKFNSSKKYPLLILLDGHVHFNSASGVVQFMSTGNTDKREIPEMIVVAIMNVDRERDFTPDKVITRRENNSGGGDDFLNFLENELIPKLDKEYRTMPYRILVGHSLGGLLTTHAYMKDNTVFNSFISIDPSFGTWDDKVMDDKIQNINESIFERSIYLATANWGKRNLRNRDRHIRFFEAINDKCKGTFNGEIEYFENKNHSSVPLPAFYNGLSYIFRGYNYSYQDTTNRHNLVQYYEDLSNRLSFDFLPPEELVNRIGYRFLRSSNNENKLKAIELFLLNSVNYPTSYNAFDSLGEAQLELGNEEDAIVSFKKSLVLNPENINAKNVIDKLKKE
ncbi:MAG: putative alpha/beta superfamily hydrolase [Saprospiraceae bacterium]|jgi:predicted alpha/beta superfamily hydrolase